MMRASENDCESDGERNGRRARRFEGRGAGGGAGLTPSTLQRAPVGQGPSGPGWLAIALRFWSGRVLAAGTAWAGLCLIHHHHWLAVGLVVIKPACNSVSFV